MARSLRLSFENAFYHITAGGIRKEKIFYSNNDKKIFLDKMNETADKYSFVCYAYCLMDDHYHLFIKTPLANLSKGMHYLNASYANWFRVKHNLVGPIFQGRYKSILVDEDSCALILSAYIHLNPLRAGMIEKLEDYPFSSYSDYIEKRKSLIKRLDTSLILSKFSNNREEAQAKYEQFVIESADLNNPLEKSYRSIALGNDSFIEKIKEKMKSIDENREIKGAKLLSILNQDEIIKNISLCFGIERDEIFKKRKGNIYRQLTIYLIKRYTALSLKEIGKIFDIDYASVSMTARRFKEKTDSDKDISEMLERITKKMEEERK